MKEPTHPMQPLVKTDDGVIRFKENAIVSRLLAAGRAGEKMDLNEIARMDFSQEDRMQLNQLIGYSVSGFGDLSTTSTQVTQVCDAMAAKMVEEDLAYLDPATESALLEKIRFLEEQLEGVKAGLRQACDVVFSIHTDDLE